MEPEAAQQPEAVQQPQIQTFLANVEELRKTIECQNLERQWIVENQNEEEQIGRLEGHNNEEESTSQANRRDMTSGEDSSRMENELCNMRKEMDKLRSAMKDKGEENLDGMIQRTDSPFTTEVLNRPFPPKFRLPQLESYDSSKDPLDHIKSFKTLMLLQMTPDEVMCRAFLMTLERVVRVWFSKIPPGTIANFEQVSKSFFRHFIGGQRHKKPIGHLLNIQQVEGESLKQYVNQFNKELLQVDEAKDQDILTTFQARLLLGDFFFSITKCPPKTVAELLWKAQKYMNAEDTMLAKEMKGKRKRDEGTINNCDKKKETRSVG